MLYYILALTPFAVWLVVAIVRSSRRPFADFLVLGVLYGLSLMVVHQVLWDVGPRWAQPAPSGRTRGAIAEPVERHRWSVRRGDRQRRYQAPPPPTRPPRDAARSGVASARAR